MPGFYQAGEYDLAGFCVGIVEKSQILDGSKVQLGDVAIGLASKGVHSNGFSLVRKIVSDRGFDWGDRPDVFDGKSLGEVLLAPTQIYVKPILAALKQGIPIHGMAHITGGGLPENLPRCLAGGQAVSVDLTTWNVLPIFHWLAAKGNVAPSAMFHTFNMGIGFVVLVPPDQVTATLNYFASQKLAAYAIGKVIPGSGVVGLPE
jgi:phosphoribosylformylglycinamidine cyclo-ligase